MDPISFFSRDDIQFEDVSSMYASDLIIYDYTGFLYKKGELRKEWKKRWFILIQKYILYFESNKKIKPRGIIGPLTNYRLEGGVDNPKKKKFQFSIVPNQGGRIYYIYASSLAHKEQWVEEIQSSIKKSFCLNNIQQIQDKLEKSGYKLRPEDLEYDNKNDVLGKGGSAVVIKGVWLNTTPVALKTLNNIPEFTDEQEKLSFFNEIVIMSKLHHPDILQMYGYCLKNSKVYIVTEFIEGGNLYDIIYDKQKDLKLILIINICISICRGMAFLHNKNIIHRDLKPGNILIENLEQAKIKICDFGISTITKGKNIEVTCDSSIPYSAPELKNIQHTEKVDIYSFAILMWEMCTREIPWKSINFMSHITEKVKKGDRLPLPQNGKLNDLIIKCWDPSPTERPSFSEIHEELDLRRNKLILESGIDENSLIGIIERPEKILLQILESKNQVLWADFSRELKANLNTTSETVEKMKYILAPGEFIDKNIWKNFLEWFSPLIPSNKIPKVTEKVWTVEDIANIVAPSFFFGFIKPALVKVVLQSMPVGSFLFRFSSTPGMYALSLNYGEVGHWKIEVHKLGNESPIFQIDKRKYQSLDDIIASHSPGKIPLFVPTTSHEIFLSKAADRNLSSSSNYESWTDLADKK